MKKISLFIFALLLCAFCVSCNNSENSADEMPFEPSEISEYSEGTQSDNKESSVLDDSLSCDNIVSNSGDVVDSSNEYSNNSSLGESDLFGIYEYSERINGVDYIVTLTFSGNEVEYAEDSGGDVNIKQCNYILEGNKIIVFFEGNEFFRGDIDKENDVIDALGYVFMK